MQDIENLINEFRQHGGKFENVALGYQKSSGYYLYTLDKEQEVVVSCPASLLVDISDIGINENGLFIDHTDKYKDSIKFLEKYFAFHFNSKILNYYIDKKRQIESLSNHDLSLISKIFKPEVYSTAKNGNLIYAKRQIIKSHHIGYFGKNVIMPFVTFLNFSKNGRPFQTDKNAISVSGKFPDEVSVEYNYCDTMMIAGQHGFITDTRFAYSIPVEIMMPNGLKVIINRNLHEAKASSDGHPYPIVKNTKDTVIISWFPLYIEKHPLYLAKVSQMMATATGVSAENFFQSVLQLNIKTLRPLGNELNKSKNAFSKVLAASIQNQIYHITKTV